MDFRPRFYHQIATALLVVFFIFTGLTPALASTGTIDATSHYAWNDNGGYVNWNATGGNVTVTDTTLTGYIWSAGFGWINLSPTQGGVTNNTGSGGGTISGLLSYGYQNGSTAPASTSSQPPESLTPTTPTPKTEPTITVALSEDF